MFFRVGEEMDHPAQEGADGGLAPGYGLELASR